MEDFRISGVAADESKALITVELARPTVLGALWERVGESQLSVLAPVFSPDGPRGDRMRVHFFGEMENESEWKRHLDRLSIDGFIAAYRFDDEQVPVSVIGQRFSQDGRALSEIIAALAEERIWVTIGSASSLAVTVSVARARAKDAVVKLHEHFLRETHTS